jgi:hypothetical protein
MHLIEFHKGFLKSTVLIVSFTATIMHSTYSQSQFEITIQQFNGEEVMGYVQPLGDMFGANMNAGLYHSAAIPRSGIHFRIDIIGMISLVGDEHRSYNAILPSGFIPLGGSRQTATVFGGTGTTFKDEDSGLEYKGSDGIFATNVFPLLVPQATIGALFGTEATVRYISTPSLAAGRFPSSTLWGVGLRHSISQYFGENPTFDLSLGSFYSRFTVGEFQGAEGAGLDFRGTAIDLQISKTILLFTFYGNIAHESSSMSLHYSYKANEASMPKLIDLTIDGGNKFRFTTGLQIDLQAIKLYADANFGYVQHFSGGIGFGF